jgi:hypothetical protein
MEIIFIPMITEFFLSNIIGENNMYFAKPGKGNTEQTLKRAFERGKELGLNEVVVASSKGDSAYKALEIFDGFQITIVTYHWGFKEPFQNLMSADVRNDLEGKVSKIITASHALSGIERSISQRHSGIYPLLLMAETFRLFGQGTKVAVEIAVMAADAGALTGADIISIGGTGRGADTALVLKPAHQNNFFELRIREIICKPRNF